MTKEKILGLGNVLLLLWFGYLLVSNPHYPFPLPSLYVAVKVYGTAVIIFAFAVLNSYLAYILFFKKKQSLNFPLLLSLTLAPVFWMLYFFFGFFFASHPLLPAIALLISGAAYYFGRKISPKLALFLSLGTIVVTGVLFISSFEESYCWDLGTRADPAGMKWVKATADDAKKLKGYGVVKDQEIAVSFRTHMLCHDTFNPADAMKKTYFNF